MANIVWIELPNTTSPPSGCLVYLRWWIELNSRIIHLESAICFVRSRFGLPEKYVELIVCPALSETIAQVIDRKALTGIGLIGHMRLSSLRSIAGGWDNLPICQYLSQSFLCGWWNMCLRGLAERPTFTLVNFRIYLPCHMYLVRR